MSATSHFTVVFKGDVEAFSTNPLRMDTGIYAGVPDVGPVFGLFADDASGQLAADGRAWRKCCSDCAYKDKAQHGAIERACVDRGAAFYCVHRDAADLRVCAGFAAVRRGRGVAPTLSPKDANTTRRPA